MVLQRPVEPARLTGEVEASTRMDGNRVNQDSSQLVEEVSNTCGYNGVGLRLMIPVSYRPVTVAQKEIALQVRADNIGFLLMPPRRFQGSPVCFTNQARDN
jgi:hypothetical protein